MEKNKNIQQYSGLMQESRRAALQRFSGIEHRLESLGDWMGVEFINDSKSTNLTSSLSSMEMIDKPLTWIIGSSEFDEDYSVFLKQVKYKVTSLVVFGSYSDEKIRQTLGVFPDRYVFVEELKDAFIEALRSTGRGGVVLFSPACASFDKFSDYRHRGECFRQMVADLKN